MSKGGSQTTTSQQQLPAWLTEAAQRNLNSANYLTSNVVNRYGNAGGVGTNAIAPYNGSFDFGTGGINIPQSGGGVPTPSQGGPPSSFIANPSDATTGFWRDAQNWQGSSAQMRGLANMMGNIANEGAFTVGDPRTATAATVGNVADISARRGSEFMNDYMNPYLSQVVDTSLADFDTGVDRSANAMRAARDAGSAFGSRSAVSDAVFQADAARGRGSLAAGLRSGAFNTALGAGQADAGRFMQADVANQNKALQTALANAQYAQQAGLFNANNANQFALANQAELARNQALRLGAQTDQVNALGRADATDLAGLTLRGDVGARQDALEQARLREPLDMLQFNQSLLGAVPVPGSSSSTTRSSPGALETAGTLGNLGYLGYLMYMCWVAREVYGQHNMRWLDFREWMLTKAPRWLLRLYIAKGPRFALWLRDKPRAKTIVRSVMEWCLR